MKGRRLRSRRIHYRAAAMAAMSREGKTLAEMGDHFGVTRERVRQILLTVGVTGSDARAVRAVGIAQARAERAQARIEKRRSKEYAKFGCTKAQIVALCGVPYRAGGDGPGWRYVEQMRAARRRGIEWEFTFPTWWEIWRDSGKWNRRGLELHGYVMSRRGDVGPYSPKNVRICTRSANIDEYWMLYRARRGTVELSTGGSA